MNKKYLSGLTILLFLAISCNFPFFATGFSGRMDGQTPVIVNASASPTPTLTRTVTLTPTTTLTPTITLVPTLAPVGPDNFPAAVNPLTGLSVNNPADLLLPPALVSITLFPVSARPAAGLSFSPWVFELFIGEGSSRLLATFYGEYPAAENTLPGVDAEVGPIRSGRLPYEHIRQLFNGFLVMASAYSGVAANLNEFTNIYGSDSDNINSALIDATQLKGFAQAQRPLTSPDNLNGNIFDTAVPPGGAPATRLWYIYAMLNQVRWEYNPALGAYQRYQDNADGATFTLATDRLNDEPLSYENVIILYADHRYCTETAFDVTLAYVPRFPAKLFRDGKTYDIYWTTKAGEYEVNTGRMRPFRFINADGTPFPLKPGQTWVHITPNHMPIWETIDSMTLFDVLNKQEPGSGLWAMRFYTSYMIEDPDVCDMIR